MYTEVYTEIQTTDDFVGNAKLKNGAPPQPKQHTKYRIHSKYGM
jgi:hypothetical protein